jgi:alpha-methylacyl-CoA racemase
VRVLELPAIGPVPFLGMLLADLGAEIVRIDKLAAATGLDGIAAGPMSRGKRSIALDLRRPGGAEVALRLAETCDVLMEGFRPGVAERLGVGPDAVHARNRALVYGRMTGWGQNGPLAATAGHDITYLALTGVLHGIGTAATPVPPVNYVADYGGGSLFLALGILGALLHARATGEGQVIDAAMVEGAGYLGSATRSLLAAGVWKDERHVNFLDGGAPNYRCYECADGKFVAVGALEPQFWALLVATLEFDDATMPSPYVRSDWEACAKALGERFRHKTRDEWAEIFSPLDACVAPVLSLTEAVDHPHLVARGSFAEVAGVAMPRPAPRFSSTQGEFGAVGQAGAATAELLAAVGYDAAGVADLRAAGVIG